MLQAGPGSPVARNCAAKVCDRAQLNVPQGVDHLFGNLRGSISRCGMMKILAISDSVEGALHEHFDAAQWRDLDLVVSCGDLPPEYLDFLCTTLACPVLYVRGNHDGHYPPDAYAGLVNLHGRSWTSNGVTIVGFEGCRRYNGDSVQYSEREMRWKVWRTTRRLPKIDLVITHAPPLGCNDRPDPCHAGFECFRDLVLRRRPRYFIHGHSHLYGAESRVSQLDSTTTVNAYGHYLLSMQ